MGGEVEDSAQGEESNSLRHRCQEALRVEWKLVLYKLQYFLLEASVELDQVYLKLWLTHGGMTQIQIGVILGLGAIAASFFTLMVAALANRYRISKAVLLITAAATAAMGYGTVFITYPTVISNCTNLELKPMYKGRFNLERLTDMSKLYNEEDLDVLFYIQLLWNMAFSIFISLTLTFTDVSLISVLSESGVNKYGSQKSFGALGIAVLSPVCGALVVVLAFKVVICGVQLDYTDYSCTYYMVGTAMAICFLISWTFKFENQNALLDPEAMAIALSASPVESEVVDDPSDLTLGKRKTSDEMKTEDDDFSFHHVAGMFASVHYVSWIIMVFLASFSWSLSTYSPLYLKELGADELLIGTAAGITSLSNFLFYLCGDWCLQKLGTINTMCLALTMRSVHFAILGVIQDPGLGLLSAALEGAAMSVGWLAMVQHVIDGFPKRYTTVVIGILHATYFGIGLGTGQIVDALLRNAIGVRETFFAFAIAMFVFTGIFLLIQKLSKRPSFDNNQSKPEMVSGSETTSAVNKSYGTSTSEISESNSL